MSDLWEERLPYALPELLVLAVFYGIYFAKVLAQKRRGIRTRQIGRRKEKSIHTVEVLMSIATLGAPMAQLMSIAFGWSHLPANARFTGFLMGLLGDGIFLLSVLCMKGQLAGGHPGQGPDGAGHHRHLSLKTLTGNRSVTIIKATERLQLMKG